jgi:hypothetical protein
MLSLSWRFMFPSHDRIMKSSTWNARRNRFFCDLKGNMRFVDTRLCCCLFHLHKSWYGKCDEFNGFCSALVWENVVWSPCRFDVVVYVASQTILRFHSQTFFAIFSNKVLTVFQFSSVLGNWKQNQSFENRLVSQWCMMTIKDGEVHIEFTPLRATACFL